MFKAFTFRPASIGDALMGKYFLENIRAQYPKARLAIVVGSRASMLRDLFAGEPWLEIIEANRRSPASLISLWRQWRGSDAVLTYYTAGTLNLSTKLIARFLARRGALTGFDDDSSLNRYLYDHLLPRPTRGRSVRLHECDALTALGVPVNVNRLSLNYVPIPGVAEKFGITGPYGIVHLFSGSKSRGFSTLHMRELLMALATEMPGTTLVLSGGPMDVTEAVEASDGLPATIIAGRASLQELMNLIIGSRVVISLDTGVGHLAAHIGRPPVILSTCFSRISWWGPDQYGPGIPAALCTRVDRCFGGHVFKSYPDCLAAIDMDAVAAKASRLL
ncbi:MAG: glycosyltransferase family 9 protein [Candidatus Paceibacterota bacterium]|jgi:ADP-heptose:LPS heptosyltransferase